MARDLGVREPRRDQRQDTQPGARHHEQRRLGRDVRPDGLRDGHRPPRGARRAGLAASPDPGDRALASRVRNGPVAFFAGTAGSVPTPKRGLPALLLRAGGDRILFDCGEGTQHQLLRSIGLPDIDAIFITHLHLDHWLGLPGMIKTFDMRDRDRPLDLFGPPGLKALYQQVLKPVIGRTKYPFDVIELEHHEEVGFDDFVIASFPVNHRVEAYGYAFIEDDRPGRFDVEAARALGVTEGPDFGRLQRGETVNGVTPEQVVGEDRPGRRIVYTGDTAPVQIGRGLRPPRRSAGPRGDVLRGR